MKLVTNKDFLKEYKNDAWRGFTIPELLSIGAALVVMALCMYLLNKLTGIPLATCVYASVPVAAPILFLGFFTYQEMSVLKLLREIWYSKKTAELHYEAGEYPGAKTFTMQGKELPGMSGSEWAEKKRLYRKRRKRGRR